MLKTKSKKKLKIRKKIRSRPRSGPRVQKSNLSSLEMAMQTKLLRLRKDWEGGIVYLEKLWKRWSKELGKKLSQCPPPRELFYRSFLFFAVRERAVLSFFCFIFLYTLIRLASLSPMPSSESKNKQAEIGYYKQEEKRLENIERKDETVTRKQSKTLRAQKASSDLSPFLPHKALIEKKKGKRKVSRLSSQIEKLRAEIQEVGPSFSAFRGQGRGKKKKEAQEKRNSKAPGEKEKSIYVVFTEENGNTLSKHISLPKKLSKDAKRQVHSFKEKAKEALEKRNYSLALRYIEEAYNYNPEDIEIDYLKGEAYYLSQKSWKKAKAAFESYLTSRPKHALTHFRLGQIYYKEGLYENASERYKKALSSKPEMYIARLNLSINLMKQRKLKEAEKNLKRLLKNRSIASKAAYYLAKLHSKRFEYRQGLILLNKYIHLYPQNPLLYQGKGEILYKMKRYGEAVLSLDRSLKYRSNYSNWLLLSAAFHAQKLYKQSLSALQNAGNIYSMDPKLHHNMGQIYLKLHQKEEALKSFERSLSISPAYKEALLSSIDLYNELSLTSREKERAFKKLERSLPYIEENSNNYDFYIRVGDFYAKRQKYEEAQQAYRSAIKGKSRNPKAYLRMVAALRKLKLYRQAELSYQELLQNVPNYAEGHRLLGLFYHKNMKMPQKAREQLKKYLSLKPEAADTNEIQKILASP